MPTVCEHHQYQYSCCVQTCTHTHTEKGDIHCGLCHRPSEVWSVCRVQRRSLLTIVLALASAGQLGSASSHTIYRSVSEKEVNQRRELKTIQSCEPGCEQGGWATGGCLMCSCWLFFRVFISIWLFLCNTCQSLGLGVSDVLCVCIDGEFSQV